MPEPAELAITEAIHLMASRDLSPIDLVTAVLDRIERFDRTLRCYIAVTAEPALDAAHRAEAKLVAGDAPAMLGAIPVGLKDVVDLAGVATTAGSAALVTSIPADDGAVTIALRGAGAAIVGKHNMHELGLGVTTDNPHFGRCRNPWNLDHIPGGSSGGSAAAVAAGLALGAIGGDSGASIRMPAAFNNLVGLKPTHGLIPADGVWSGTWSLDSTGPITRTVEDNAVMLQAVTGGAAKRTRSDYRKFERRTDLEGTIVGVPDDYFFEDLDGDVAAAVENALATLEDLGARMVEISVPSARYAVDAGAVISWAEYATSQSVLLRESGGDLGEDVRTLLEVASTHLASDYIAAQQARTQMSREYRGAWDHVDAIATPTVAIPPPPIGSDVMLEVAKLTRIASLTGEPALSVPCGFTVDGLPVGLHLQGPHYSEPRLYEIAYTYEQTTGWHLARPDTAAWISP